MKTLSREKLKVVAARADASEQGNYVLDEQAGDREHRPGRRGHDGCGGGRRLLSVAGGRAHQDAQTDQE